MQKAEIPGWLMFTIIAVVVVVAGFFVFRGLSGGGPRNPKTYPKEAYQPPAYAAPQGMQGYSKDGKPIQ